MLVVRAFGCFGFMRVCISVYVSMLFATSDFVHMIIVCVCGCAHNSEVWKNLLACGSIEEHLDAFESI